MEDCAENKNPRHYDHASSHLIQRKSVQSEKSEHRKKSDHNQKKVYKCEMKEIVPDIREILFQKKLKHAYKIIKIPVMVKVL